MKFGDKNIKSGIWMVLRYIVSGFTGIGANLVVFSFIVTFTELWIIYGSVFGFIAAYVVTFLMHKYWTFENSSRELFYKQSMVYFFSAVGTLVINTSILYVLVTLVFMHPIVAQFVSLLIAALLSFLFTTQVTFHINETRIHALTRFFHVGVFTFIKKQRVQLMFLLAVMCVVVVLRVVAFPLTYTTDSESYVATAYLLLGDAHADIYGERILKPLAPAALASFTFFGFDPGQALLVQAIFFYFALGFAAFWFGFELFKKPWHAFTLAVIVVTSYPIFRYGINYYTETGIWTLYFATLASIVRWFIRPSFRLLILISALLLLGLLWKEYAVLVGIVFGLAILFQSMLSWKEKLHAIIQTGFLVLIPWGIWQYAVYYIYDYSYFNWIAIGSAPSAYESEYTLLKVTKTLFGLLLGMWPFVLIGLLKVNALSIKVRQVLLLMLAPSFGFLLWGFVSSRLFFSLVPLVVPLAALGFMSIQSNRFRIVYVLLILALNSILITLAFDPSIRMILNHYS